MSFPNAPRYFRALRLRVKGVTEQQLRDGVVALALEGLTGVSELTPVDTGRLRGAWDVEIGGERITSAPAEQAFGPRGADSTGAAALRASLDRGQSKLAEMRVPEDVRLVNNVDYGVHVNDGTPNVPPVLMVERTAARLRGRR